MSVSDTPGTTYGTEETRATLDEAFETDDTLDAGCPQTEFCGTYFDCF